MFTKGTTSSLRFFSSIAKDAAEIHISTHTNPFFNLAYEEYLFQTKDPSIHTFFWWRAEPTVLIGRFQNPWKECNIKVMEEQRVHLLRRKSGGGAIYQDLGNSIFGFMSPKNKFSIVRNNEVITSTLEAMGIHAVPTGRNDINVNDKKVSGAAFRHSKDTSLHHGTLLLNLNMNALGGILMPDKRKLESKGVSSVAARVTNLKEYNPEIDHDDLGKKVSETFAKLFDGNVKRIDVKEPVYKREIFQQAYTELNDWDWRFGKTPQFSNKMDTRFQWGIIDMHFQCEKGIITQCTIFSDCLFPILIESVQSKLIGKIYNKDGISLAMTEVKAEMKLIQSPAIEFVPEWETWMLSQL